MLKIKFSSLSIGAISLLIGMLVFQKAISQSLSVPSFRMQLTNGSSFSSKKLSPVKPLVLIYFAPDCDHCRLLMDTVFKRINEFKNSQIVMVTFKPLNEVAGFEKQYKTGKYKNIIVGTEVPMFFFKNYYQLDNTPFTALYDKHRKLIISYKRQTPVDDLLKILKKLK